MFNPTDEVAAVVPAIFKTSTWGGAFCEAKCVATPGFVGKATVYEREERSISCWIRCR